MKSRVAKTVESFDNLLNKILAKSPATKREDILRMVEERKNLSNGLLSDLGAISLLAQQLSVNQDGIATLADQKIASVHAGLSDITITGEVIDISEPREFTRQDGTGGKVLRITVSDESGRVNCALWDDHSTVVTQQGVTVGAKVRIEHGYTKHGRAGEVEIHLGNRGRITLLTQSPSTSETRTDTPVLDMEAPLARIAELAEKPGLLMRRIRVRVRKLQGQRTVDGPVTALCEDETGLVMVKFWDERINEILQLGENKTIIIENPMVTERNGILYVNSGRSSAIKPDAEAEQKSVSSLLATIASLKPSPVLRVLRGKIVERTEVREVETREGRRVRVSNIRIEDETGRIRVSLWDRHASNAETLRLGDTVKLIGVRVREGFNREVEASSVFLTEIEKAR